MPAFSTARSDARSRFSPTAFLRSVTPALDDAFGLDIDPDLPDELAALVARLQDEPEPVFAQAAASIMEPEAVESEAFESEALAA